MLARGLGTRMRAGSGVGLTGAQAQAAAAGQKGMMPLRTADGQSRPFLDFLLSALADAGYRHVVLVVPPLVAGAADPMREYYTGSGTPARVRITFAVQAEARGTADALVAAAGAIDGRPFVVLNADNLYGVDTLQALREADGPALPVYERADLVASSGIPDERVASFALLDVSADGVLRDISEKPGVERMEAEGPRALISMNAWRGDAQLLQACRDVEASPRGEYELPSAVRLAIRRGAIVRAIPARGPVYDLSRQEDVPHVMALLGHRQVHP